MKSTTVSRRMRNPASKHEAVIDISFSSDADRHPGFVTSLCTLDSLTGNARITMPIDTRFDTVEIALEGTSQTLVDRMSPAYAVPKAQSAFHKFLDLRQPDTDEKLPEDRMLRAGVTYNVPFNFVIPDRMSENLCRHKVNSTEVRQHHHLLPPSLGDSEVSDPGKTLLDDMSSQMCRISYHISVRVMQRRISDGRQATLAEKLRKLRILPAVEEQPSLEADVHNDEYCLSAELKIRTSLMGRKLGTVTTRVKQSRSFVLPAVDTNSDGPVTNTSTIMLRFDPSNTDSQPPRLNKLSTKLKVSTFYASKPLTEFASRAKYVYDASQGLYTVTLPLNSRNMECVQWTKHEHAMEAPLDAPRVRHDSGISIASTTPGTRPSRPFYIAQIILPSTLPTNNKSFVPTFHSCLVSRTYALELSLNFSTQGSGPSLFNKVDLCVPVQIAATPSSQHLARRASYSAEIDMQYDDYCAPLSEMLAVVHGIPTMLAMHDGPPAYAPHGIDKGPLPLYT